MPLYNDLYELALGFPAYSDEGFFDICPFTDRAGVSYPTHLTFRGNTVLAEDVFPRVARIVERAGVRGSSATGTEPVAASTP
jgi:hypothetical protein